MQWELARPKEFIKIAKEEQLCIVPIGCLERHNEHSPLGTDGLIVHKIAVEAAKIEPCMVFPVMYLGAQVHESTSMSGAVAISNEVTFKLWDEICAEIARNGFKKILFLNGHGGNTAFLDHYALSRIDHTEDYTFYYMDYDRDLTPEDNAKALEIEPRRGEGIYTGHACAWETDVVMAAAPGCVNFDYLETRETFEPGRRSEHLGRIKTGLQWYSNWPNNDVGSPAIATKEKGDKLMEIYINQLVKDIKTIKEDKVIPELRKEFLRRKNEVGKFDG